MPALTSAPLTLLVVAVLAYLLGAIPFGIVITRALGLGDLRAIGSGNIGATNVLRTVNKAAAAATLILDAAKGGVAVVIARAAVGEDLKPYECDGLTAYRCLPWAVVLPQNEQQVVAALKVCHARQVPVVARGAGTGLSGGATPVVQGVVLSLARFMRILEIDPLARLARVQPGVGQ